MSNVNSELPGTPLTNEQFAKGQVITVKGSAHARYAWDAGIGIGHYLAGLKCGKLTGSHCARCARTVVPPRAFCEDCFSPAVTFVDLKDSGTINTFSICRVAWDASRLETPELPAVIEIDGASTGCGILHMLGEVDPGRVSVGMRVQAVWKPPSEREGAITDIKYFRPL